MGVKEVWFDSKSGSAGVFILAGVKPVKDRKSGARSLDLKLVAGRDENDVVLGRDLKFAEDRAQVVAAGQSPTTKLEVQPHELGAMTFQAVKDGHAAQEIGRVNAAVVRTVQLVMKKGGLRAAVVVRVPLDEGTQGLVGLFGDDVHVTWTPAQQGLVFTGQVPGQAEATDDQDEDVDSAGGEAPRSRRGRRGDR